MDPPLEYRWAIAHGFKLLTPWHLVEPEAKAQLRREFQLETGMDILPFARRQDNDEIAGFPVSGSNVQSTLLTVHLTWLGRREEGGYPSAKSSKDFFDWVSEVVFPATREWMAEEDLDLVS